MAKEQEKKMEDPREWLKKKLGAANFAKFEEGMRNVAAAKKGKKADVQGQRYCDCQSACYWNTGMASGAYCADANM